MKVVARRVHPLIAALILFALTPLFARSLAEAVPDAPPTATEPVADPLRWSDRSCPVHGAHA